MKKTERIRLLNIYIDNVTMNEALDRIEYMIKEKNNSYVFTPNVDHIVKIEKDPLLKTAYENADLILADGMPLLWIASFNKMPLAEKISGTDLFPRLCERAAMKKYKLFFLGAAEGVGEKAADKLKNRYPGLQIVGTYSPPFGFEKDQSELSKIEINIKEHAPDILIVCFGTPKQEKYIYTQKERLSVPVCIGLGSSLDIEAGIKKRAPYWMQQCGLEWLYRFIKEPHRMYKRYFIDDIQILKIIIKNYKKRNTGTNGKQ